MQIKIKNMYSLKTKITAVFLVLAFTQKLGAGLYLHNWLHAFKNYGSKNKTAAAFDERQILCSCLDDALVPLTPTAGIDEIKIPVRYFSSSPNSYHSPTFSVAKIFCGLRGPPGKAA
jgi:hypothetical protein